MRGQEDSKAIERVAKLLSLKQGPFTFSSVSITTWNGLNIIPSTNYFNETTTLASLSQRHGKPSLSFQLQDKPFPKGVEGRRFLQQYFAVSIQPPLGVESDGFTMNVPLLPDLNEWYAGEMIFDPNSLRVEKGILGTSISLIAEADEDTLQIGLVSKSDLIKKVFERAGITVNKSGAGQVAERLIALMEGLTGSARIFKITGVRKFIEGTEPFHQKLRYEVTSAIRDKTATGETFKNFENEFGLRGKRPITPDDVFDELVEHNLLQVGIEARCPKCSLRNWVHLKEVNEYYTCELCSEKSKFVKVVEPITSKDGTKVDGMRLHYRLSGLLGRNDKQQGAIPVILTLQFLENSMRIAGKYLYSTALDLSFTHHRQEVKSEIDFVMFDLNSGSDKESIEVLIGECKTSNAISKKQIDGLVVVRELLEKSGIKCHLLFSKIKKEFTSNEIAHFKSLVKNGIRPILLTAHEVEPWWDEYRYYRAKHQNFQLPQQHPLNFRELADNSVYIYKLDKD